MAFPLLAILPGAIKAVAKVLGVSKVEDAVTALMSGTIPPEKQAELQLALLEHEQQMKQLGIEEMKTALSESLAMIQSEDKFVKRARPFGLYTFYLASLAAVGAVVLGVKVDAAALLTILAPLGGVSGTYIYNRTREKLNGGTSVGA